MEAQQAAARVVRCEVELAEAKVRRLCKPCSRVSFEGLPTSSPTQIDSFDIAHLLARFSHDWSRLKRASSQARQDSASIAAAEQRLQEEKEQVHLPHGLLRAVQ